MNKYGNRKVEYNGHIFHSKAEMNRYIELELFLKAGKIGNLELQSRFELIPKTGKERSVNYIADFKYKEYLPTGLYIEVVEDVKGAKTKDYIIKRKLFKWLYPEYEFREIKAR